MLSSKSDYTEVESLVKNVAKWFYKGPLKHKKVGKNVYDITGIANKCPPVNPLINEWKICGSAIVLYYYSLSLANKYIVRY